MIFWRQYHNGGKGSAPGLGGRWGPIKVLIACGSGIATSQIIEMKVRAVFAKYNVPVQLSHCKISDVAEEEATPDVIICPLNFVDSFTNLASQGVKVVGIKNILSGQEIEAQILEKVIDKNGA